MKSKSKRKHVVSRMIVASSNILRKGIHIIMTEEHRKFTPVYTCNEPTN